VGQVVEPALHLGADERLGRIVVHQLDELAHHLVTKGVAR
jgi:hypothetical protein